MVEGALVAIDNHTGQVLAMVGGFSFARSKFNRATQAHRQLGSTFKPILYTAAIDRGLTPTSVLDRCAGRVQCRRRTAAVHAGQLRRQVRRAGDAAARAREVAQYSRRARHGNARPAAGRRLCQAVRLPRGVPAVLSTALGAAEATLLETTSAYTAFPNQGIRLQPYQVMAVLDREGNVLEETRPAPRDAIRADTAFVMTNLMRGVVQRGTAAAPPPSTGRWPARRAPWTTTPTRGSSASIRTSPSACGSATTKRSRSATARPAR